MTFLTLILITLAYWSVIAFAAWIMCRIGLRLWRVQWFKSLVKWGSIVLAVIALLTLANSGYGAYLAIALFAVPFFILAFIQASFWTFHWIKHGNPFYEKPDAPTKEIVYIGPDGEDTRKRVKKFCPICKRNTMCRVSRSIGLGAWIHVMR